MPSLTRSTFGVAFLLFSFSAKAQQSAVNEQDWITRNQQNIIEETKRNKELDEIEKDRERRKKADQEKNWQEFNASGKTKGSIEYPK